MEINGQEIRGSEVKHLPIISAYASRIGLVEAIDNLKDFICVADSALITQDNLSLIDGWGQEIDLSTYYVHADY